MDELIKYLIIGVFFIFILIKWNSKATDNQVQEQKYNIDNYYNSRKIKEIDAKARKNKQEANTGIIVWVIIIIAFIYFINN